MHTENIFNIQGKRIVVTGAGRGIGLSIAKMLAVQGARVTLVSRNEPELRRAVEEITQNGGEADWLVLDITDTGALKRSKLASRTFDVLINNAGTNRPMPFIDIAEEDYDAVMNLNIKSIFFFTQLIVKKMISEKIPGSVINMSSQMGHVGAANRTIYCTSKFAVEGLTRSLAVELGRHQIRVNSIAPTFIETPMTAGFLQNDTFREEVLGKIKTGRLAKEKDLFGAVLLLASDASSMMTGSSLIVDGGWTAD